jgi:cell division protein FtsA
MINREIHAVGLDIGTSKIRCVIGEPSENGLMSIVGIGEAESRGLRRGIVSTTDLVAETIKRAVDDAEQISGLEIQMATVNLSGEHLQGENKGGVVAVAGAGREITDEDVERAIESASAMPLPAGWEIIDRLPQEFIIDGQDGITEPVGMRGARLESRVHVIISPSAGKQNIEKAVNRAGLEVEGMILEPLAAATAALTDDDKEYGCALINIGAELTSLMIFGRGAVQHTRIFPFGGMHFTKDIALGLRVSIPEANAIKHGLRVRRAVPFPRGRGTRGDRDQSRRAQRNPRTVERNLMRHHGAAGDRTASASCERGEPDGRPEFERSRSDGRRRPDARDGRDRRTGV